MSNKTDDKAMKPATQRSLVPQLRFPEFREAGEWETVPMGSLLARTPEYGVNAPAVPYSADLPTYLRITDIDDDGHFLPESKVSVDIVATDSNYLEPGDIVLARTGASVGKSYRYRTEDGRLVFAGFLIRIKPDPKKVDPIFLANFLTTQQYWSWVGVTSARSGQPGINGIEYSSLPVPVPSSASDNNGLLEQKRIADCLASLDELITLEAQKLDALKTHKKGLMQQLFPRDGATLPQLRFPEFRDKGEWECGQLGTMCDGISSGKDKNDPNGEYDLYGSTGVIGKTSNDTYNGEFLLVARVGANAGLLTKVNGKFGVTDNTLVIRLNKKANLDFVFYCLDNIHLNKLVFGSGQPLITGGQLKDLSLSIPQRPEQQKIADCLASLDALITAQTQKLDALKTHKKGLMQQLFPFVEGVAVDAQAATDGVVK